MSKKSFIINAEGNRDIGLSPLPQTETWWIITMSYKTTSYPLFAVED